MKLFLFAVLILASAMTCYHAYADNKISRAAETIVSERYSNKEFEARVADQFKTDGEWKKIRSTSTFETWVRDNDYQIMSGKKIWNKIIFKTDSTRRYSGVKSDGNTVVVFPIFTDSAYSEPGFYTYYNKRCDEKCLTVKIQNSFLPQANPNAVQILKLLDYSFVTDIDVDENPSILNKYDKVIILHNEYVTKKEFDAITSHPNVVYLYPNALYAEVKTDYSKNTITLVRGHSYPSKEIENGFEWKFDNSQFEYDRDCKKIQFNRIDNGWMLNCYPENTIHKSLKFLETVKRL